jgi:hypothetical protein
VRRIGQEPAQLLAMEASGSDDEHA